MKKLKTKPKRKVFRVTEELHGKVVELSELKERSIQWIVKEAVNEYLNKYEKEKEEIIERGD